MAANPSPTRVTATNQKSFTPPLPRFKFPPSMIERFPELAAAVEAHDIACDEWEQNMTLNNNPPSN